MNFIKRLVIDDGFLKYFKNTSWLFSEKILRMTIGLFVGIWVARYLGPEQFGLFNYSLSFVGLFTAFATLGLDGIVIRELIKDSNRRDELIGTVFWLKVMGAFGVLTLLAFAVGLTSNNDYTNTLIFIVASATIFQSFNVIDFYFQSKVMSKYVVYSNVITMILSSLIKIVLILNNAPLILFAWVVLFDSMVLALGFIYFFLNNSKFKIKHLVFSKVTALTLLKDSWPLILSGIVVSIYMKIDQVMLQEMLNSEAVGQYAAAVRISELWYFIPAVVVSSLFPAIVNAKKHSEELYYGRLQKLYNLMVWMAIAVALPMTFLSDWVVDMLYGEQYSEAGSILMWHIWAGVSVFFGIANNSWILNENLQKYRLYIDSFGAITNVALNLLLIPLYGGVGAALATLISYFGTTLIVFSLVPKLRLGLKMFFIALAFPIYAIKK